MFKNISIKAKVLLGSIIPLTLFIFLGAVCIYSLSVLKTTNHWVDHTHNVIQNAMSITAAAVDMETGMRGYLLAGKKEFLAPYTQGNKQFKILTDKLKITVNDNPSQIQLLNEIQTTISDWKFNVTEKMIELRRKVGHTNTMDDMATVVGEAKGKKYFDKFREQINTFIKREEVLMKERQLAAESTTNKTYFFILSGLLLSISLCLLTSIIIIRSISPIKPIAHLISRISKGELSIKIPEHTNKDEIAILTNSMQTMISSLKKKSKLASELSNGNLDVTIETPAPEDTLGQAMQTMLISLKEKARIASEILEIK